jgi:Ca2+:H+ antiporter
LILTLSVISIEIFTVSAVMLKGEVNPTLARDTMFAVIMVVVNGLIGLALLLGGWKHHEQQYNLRGTSAFLSVMVVLAVLGLVMPNYTHATANLAFALPQEVFLILVSIGIYVLFLVTQTTRHRSYFVLEDVDSNRHSQPLAHAGKRVALHTSLLVAYLTLVIFLAEKLATLINVGLEVLQAPPTLGALLVAVLILCPEGLGAVRAALANDMQRSVNILLGSALSTLALTIPAVLIVGLAVGHPVILGLEGADQTMLLLSLLVSVITFASGRTNILQGAVHLILFFAYLLLVLRTA